MASEPRSCDPTDSGSGLGADATPRAGESFARQPDSAREPDPVEGPYRLLAAGYDALPGVQARDDVPFYVELARRAQGPVLELGAGTGRVLLEIARQGIPVTGLDSSSSMLGRLRTKGPPPTLRLAHGSMRRFDLGGDRFCLIYAAFWSFQHLLEREAQLDCLACVRRHLAPGGAFAFDLRPAAALAGSRQVQLDPDPAASQQSAVTLYPFTVEELQALLQEAGFDEIELFGGFDRRAYDAVGGSDLVCVARVRTGDVQSRQANARNRPTTTTVPT